MSQIISVYNQLAQIFNESSEDAIKQLAQLALLDLDRFVREQPQVTSEQLRLHFVECWTFVKDAQKAPPTTTRIEQTKASLVTIKECAKFGLGIHRSEIVTMQEAGQNHG